MRFDSIHIPAFGPFTDFKLKFDRSDHDLHILYGPNEAGKSSLLRGIHQMLYGVPARSTDNFIHRHKGFRLGATISQGEQHVSFLRKKGNVNTLLDTAGNTVDEGTLTPFLGSVNDDFFEKMFGLNTESLREGARSLLSGEGSLGVQLFSASLGGTSIEKAIEKLEEEANRLYSGGARVNRTILPALDAYKDGEKMAKDVTTKVTEWKKHLKELQQAREAFEDSDRECSENQKEFRKQDALFKATPFFQTYKRLENELKELSAPTVSSDFIERFRKVEEELRTLSLTIRQSEESIRRRKEEVNEIPETSLVVDQAAPIDTLANGLETYLDTIEHLETLSTEITRIEKELTLAAEQLGMQDISDLDQLETIPEAVRGEFRQLAQKLNRQTEEKARLEETYESLKAEIAGIEEKLNRLQAPSDTIELEVLRKQCVSHQGHIAGQIQRENELKSLERGIETSRAQLKLETTESEIVSLSVPGEDRIREQQTSLMKLEERRDELAREIEKNEDLRNDAESSLVQLQKQTIIYQLLDLEEARKQRDERLKQLEKNCISGTTAHIQKEFSEVDTAIQKTDEISDALRDNAGNITKASQCEHEINKAGRQIDALNKRKDDTDSKIERWTQEWRDQCAGLPSLPTSPSELLDWREGWDELCDKYETRASKLQESQRHAEKDQKLVEALQAGLHSEQSDFDALQGELDECLDKAKQAQGRKQSLDETLSTKKTQFATTTREMEKSCEDFEQSNETWKTLCHNHNIDAELDPETILELLELRQTAKQTYLQHASRLKEREKKSDKVTSFENHLQEIADKLLDEGEGGDVETRVTLLKTQVQESRKFQTRKETLQGQIQEEEATLKDKAIKKEKYEKDLQSFLEQAKVDELSGMEDVIVVIEEKRELEKKLYSCRETLESLAGNTELEQLFEALKSVDTDQLQNRITDLQNAEKPLQAKRDDARKVLDELERTDEAYKLASDEAAKCKQDAMNALSRLTADAQRFIRLQYAITFLQDQVEAYRRQSQGPMMEKTSQYFSALTNNRYSGVAAQLDDKGAPQLVAKLNEDESGTPAREVHTSGLSEGTADQLYLSLRLAAIDLHLDKHTPMPLILDDLLITFDNERTQALLPVLAELSKKTQVLIFTHHPHILDLAEASKCPHSTHRIQV